MRLDAGLLLGEPEQLRNYPKNWSGLGRNETISAWGQAWSGLWHKFLSSEALIWDRDREVPFPPHPTPHILDFTIGKRVRTGRWREWVGVSQCGVLWKSAFSTVLQNWTSFLFQMSALEEVSLYLPQPDSNLTLHGDCFVSPQATLVS